MLRNYLKIAFRNLFKNKVYSLINTVGLATGMACAILMLLWVQYELSYDHFHENKQEIYRITTSTETNNSKVISPTCPRPLGQALKENLPGVICFSTFQSYPKIVVRNEEKRFYETNVSGADSSFFKIFSFQFIKGSPDQALRNPFSVVLTQNMANKYFGNNDPINEDLEIDGVMHKVTGVIEDIPSQSHIQFDFLTSSQIMEKYNSSTNWESICWSCYILIQKNTRIKDVITGMNTIVFSHLPIFVTNYKMHCDLQPLSDIHLNSQYSYEYGMVTDIKIIYIVITIACLILLIACFNFMNLSTAMATNRIKEIGLRKVVGSNRKQLLLQFIGECLFLTVIATAIAVCLVEFILPVFNQFYHITLQIKFLNVKNIISLITLILIVGIIAGSYPAFYLSSLNPTHVLKGDIKKGAKRVVFRKALIICQSSISIGLIICAIILSQQVHFLLNKDLGFDKDNIIYLPINGKVAENYQVIKNELLEHRYISNISAKDYLPTATWNNTTDIDWEGNDYKGSVKVQEHECDYDYFQTLNISFTRGRNFSPEHTTDATEAFILNEEAIKQIGLESPIGKTFSLHGREGKIIGVVKNAYFQSLQNKIVPKVYSFLSNFSKHTEGVILIKYKVNEFRKLQDIIKSVENAMLKYNPDYPFEFGFLDEKLEQNYVQIEQFNTIIKYLTLLAVLTAFLGLFGLTLFIIRQRTKEIGIRKVLGASISRITFILSEEFVVLVLLSNTIAWPVAYYVMHTWLQGFAYRIDLTIWPFLLGGVLALFVALFTVSWQAIRAARANPIEALRYE